MLLHQVIEVGALHVFHGDETVVANLIKIVDDDNVGMGKLGRGPRLLLKAPHCFSVLPILANHLQSHDSIQALLHGLEDLAHASLA